MGHSEILGYVAVLAVVELRSEAVVAVGAAAAAAAPEKALPES